jgi:hypothetical protein
MSDLTNASQEVTLTDESTGAKCNPNSDGSLPVTLVGATGSTRIDPAQENGNLLTIKNDIASIKNTDGVKKITDALPVGNNVIGQIKITDGTNIAGVDATNHQYVSGKSAAGTSPASNPVYVSGIDVNGLKRGLLLDNTGALVQIGQNRATYSAAVYALAGYNGATDIVTITGSATKTIKIRKVRVGGITTGGNTQFNFRLIKRSTANSGGTSAAIPIVAHDSTDPAASATVLAYSANATLGTYVGDISSSVVTLLKVNAVGTLINYLLYDDAMNDKSLTLRGINEVVAVNLNAVNTASNLNITIEWTEE